MVKWSLTPSLFYHFYFTSALFFRRKRPLFVDKRIAQILQSSLCFCWSLYTVTAAVMNFSMKIIWIFPQFCKEVAKTHAFNTGFFQASGSNCLWSLVAWTDIAILSIPKDYKFIINWIWAAISVLPSSSTKYKKVPWPSGFSGFY